MIATARYALADDFTLKLERVCQPTLVIRGHRDQIVSQAWAERDGTTANAAECPRRA